MANILRIALLIPILSVCTTVFAVDFSYFDNDPLKNSATLSHHHENNPGNINSKHTRKTTNDCLFENTHNTHNDGHCVLSVAIGYSPSSVILDNLIVSTLFHTTSPPLVIFPIEHRPQ